MYRGIGGGGMAVGAGGLVVTGSPVATWTVVGVALLVVGTLLLRASKVRRSR